VLADDAQTCMAADAVARIVAYLVEEDSDSIVIELIAALNPDALDGVSEWSHCWLIFASRSGQIDMRLFGIESVVGRKLKLLKLDECQMPVMQIVDIKPFHPLDQRHSE